MLIAEDILLLATDDTTGKTKVASIELDAALAGALLVELAGAARIEFQGTGRAAKVVVTDTAPLGDALLDAALRSLAEKTLLRAGAAIRRLGHGLRMQLHADLRDRGVERQETGSVLGLIPTTRWPVRDADYETGLREAILAALRQGGQPDDRVAAVISLLAAANMLGTVVPHPQLKAARARAQEIGAGSAAGDSVRTAIAQAQAVVAAAVVAAVAAGNPN